MATTTVTNPQIIKVTNTSATNVAPLVPYHENFVYRVSAGAVIEFPVTTVGQALYYLKQAFGDLTVEAVAAYSASGATQYKLPGTITLTAPADKDVAFVPYRENFTQVIAKGDSLALPVTTIGQALYYIEQADLGITVEYENPSGEE